MEIRKIKLRNFRNIKKAELNFIKGKNIIIGNNGVGKTNILESIYLLSLTKSFRTNNDSELIKDDVERSNVEGHFKDKHYVEKVRYILNQNTKEIYLNNDKVRKFSNFIGKYPIIISTPDDVLIIKQSPGLRRNFLNISISQFNDKYINVMNEYNKLLKHRNDYLKKLMNNKDQDKTYFKVLTSKLIDKAIYIYKERKAYIDYINQYIGDIYKSISNLDDLKLIYLPNLDIDSFEQDDLRKILEEKYEKEYYSELRLGSTLYGPHRDDFIFDRFGDDMKIYSSEGEKKLAVIALKLSEIKLFQEVKNKEPIILFDDLFSELDSKNKNRLVDFIPDDLQVIITSNDLRGVSIKIREKAKVFRVIDGEVKVEKYGSEK